LLIVGKVQLVVVLALDKITVLILIFPANLRPFVVNHALVVFVRKMPALVLDVDIPVAVLDEHSYALVAEIPPYIVIVLLIFRRLNRQGNVPAAKPDTFPTLILFSHYHKLQTSLLKLTDSPCHTCESRYPVVRRLSRFPLSRE